jgi:hypothetical protein
MLRLIAVTFSIAVLAGCGGGDASGSNGGGSSCPEGFVACGNACYDNCDRNHDGWLAGTELDCDNSCVRHCENACPDR